MIMIKHAHKDLYIQTEIDSSGMDAFLTTQAHADTFDSKERAEKFILRLKERFPKDEFVVVGE